MAAIQCHQAINLALANFIYDVRDRLDKDHPYKSSVEASCNEQAPPTPNSEEETLRGYVRKIFHDPSLEKWITLYDRPNRPSRGCTMSDSCQKENRSSEFRSHPLIVRQWMVTAPPFLSLSEYLFLECNRSWGEVKVQVQLGEYKERVLSLGVSFFKYLMNISDTRRTAFQYGLINGISEDGGKTETSCPILRLYCDLDLDAAPDAPYNKEILKEFQVCSKMPDGSGRTLVHILLATNIPTSTEKITIWGRLLRTLNWNVLRQYVSGEQEWHVFNIFNMADVYAANGWPRRENYHLLWDESLSSEKIVLTSPHLRDYMRISWLENVLLDRNVLPQFSPTGVFARLLVRTGVIKVDFITSLQYAVLVGNTRTVELLAKDDRICDNARIKEDKSSGGFMSSLHYAAEQGDLEKIRSILGTDKFDPHIYDGSGNTLLQSAVCCEQPSSVLLLLQDYVDIPTMSIHKQSNLSRTEDTEGMTEHAGKQPCQSSEHRREQLDIESNRPGCVNYLLQVGLDVWQTDSDNKIPDPGPKASRDYKKWWYDKVEKETHNQKMGFGAAANAISVTAALVATASYIGPLQPPLGYNLVDEDHISKMLVDISPVRIFVVCNNLAFFFALMAITLSLTPSVPIPKESILEVVSRMRRSITLALIALIVSMTAILIAFASAVTAVIPNEGNEKRRWLSTSTLVIGGSLCLFFLALCCIRFVRLLLHNNITFRRWYKRWVFI
ncbi:hypothetical protein R1sor_011508 [Riccia sorocarpa]|uniref:PGG domain-containing protein n=1 Tax=Riccia sorocarpa TaxID=122646 RepID=A0ABD3I3T8_9MARC